MTVGEVAVAGLGSGLDAVGAQGGVFGLIDEDAGIIRVIQNRGYQDTAGPIGRTVSLDAATMLSDAMRGGEPVFISSRDAFVERHPGVSPAPSGLGFRSWTALPLVASGRPLGVLGLAFRGTRRFEREDREVLAAFASQCAQALERAQLYEGQRRVAEVLQRSLLPDRVSELPSIRTAARYVAGGPNVEVGGDWYDVVALPDGLLAVTIGDVAGRGTRAAAVMGHFRTALRAYALTYPDPGEAIRALARHLGVYEEVDLATLLYMTLDPMTVELQNATAGHPPGLIREPDGSTRFLDASPAPPLGAGSVGSYTSSGDALPEGATLVLYTDGLIERRGESLDEGFARLAEAVRAGPAEPDALCDHLVDVMIGDAERADDVALIVIVRDPIPARLHLELPARPSVLPRMRRELRSWMARTDLANDVASDVLLAISEAANNAIAHAYGVGDGTFEVELALDGEDVVAEVRDEGTWRRRLARREPGSDPGDVLDRGSPATVSADRGGRGIELIRGTMDDVTIDRTDAGTTISMRRRAQVRP
jgi:serine phosphatase RsbU (regulator of sigma subunit)/anti-sigma regulatory factor (Ser/Thr protein kinase)